MDPTFNIALNMYYLLWYSWVTYSYLYILSLFSFSHLSLNKKFIFTKYQILWKKTGSNLNPVASQSYNVTGNWTLTTSSFLAQNYVSNRRDFWVNILHSSHDDMNCFISSQSHKNMLVSSFLLLSGVVM